MSSIKIIELVVLAGCVATAIWAVRAKRIFYVVAAIIIALTVLIDLAA